MKKLNIAREVKHTAFVCDCLEKDKVTGKPFCIYKENSPKSDQPKGFPKHFKTKGEAEKYLQQMEMFKDMAEKKKKKK